MTTHLTVSDGEVLWDSSIAGTHAPVVRGDGLVEIVPLTAFPAAAVSADVARSIDGGTTWETVAEGIDPNTTILDRTAPLVPLQYRATAWSAIPSSAVGEAVGVTPGADRGYLSGGDGYAILLPIDVGLGGPPSYSLEEGLSDVSVVGYEGRPLPVRYAGDARGRTGSITFAVSRDDLSVLSTLAHLATPVLLRTPYGDTVYASLGRISRAPIAGGGWWSVSVPVTEVDHS